MQYLQIVLKRNGAVVTPAHVNSASLSMDFGDNWYTKPLEYNSALSAWLYPLLTPDYKIPVGNRYIQAKADFGSYSSLSDVQDVYLEPVPTGYHADYLLRGTVEMELKNSEGLKAQPATELTSEQKDQLIAELLRKVKENG